MTAPRAREHASPPSPSDRRPPRRGGGSSSENASAAGRLAGSARPPAARRGLVRSARALAAAVLLALSGALALPAPAQAQATCTLNTGDFWCGVVTVASPGTGFLGFYDSLAGMLSDDDFQLVDDSNVTHSYTIEGLVIEANGDMTVSFDSILDNDERAALNATELHVGSGFMRQFSDDNLTSQESARSYKFLNTGLSWSVGDTVTLRLRAPDNTAPVFSGTTATRTVPENSTVGTSVGAVVTATDADNDTLTYSLEGTDAASFDIDSGTGQIKTKSGVTYNHEATKNSYSVTVKASDGTESDTITVTISVTDVAEQPSKPSAPTLAQVTGSATSLSASWSAPGLNGGPALTGYQMQYREGSTGTWSSSTSHGATVTTATITGLTADTAYQVQVRALNGEAPSDWSEPSASVRTNDLPTLSIADANARENSDVEFTVTLSPESAVAVTVAWRAESLASNTAVAGTDYTAANGVLTFAATETSKTFTVSVTDDNAHEDGETFTVTLSNPTNAALSAATATGLILDNDAQPTVGVAGSSAIEGSPVEFTVTLTPASGKQATVNVEASIRPGDTAEAGDFTAKTETLTFAAGETSKTVTVATTHDTTDEPDETFTLRVTSTSSAQFVGADTTVKGTITNNDDPPRLSVQGGSAMEGDDVTFTVTLSAASGKTVTVHAATSKGSLGTASSSDYTAVSMTLSFAADETSKQVTVQTVEDTTDEDNEKFTLTLSTPVNATISDASALGTINDDDTAPTLSVADASATEGGPVRFTVTLSAASGKTVTVTAATSVGTAGADDFTAKTETLTFAPGDTSKTVTVTTTDDELDEEDTETFTLTLSGASNATLSTTAATATGTIQDNDDEPRITIGRTTVNEGDGEIEVPLTLNAASGREVSALWLVSLTSTDSTDPAEAEDIAGSLTNPDPNRKIVFPPGSTSEQIRITLVDDTTDEPNEAFLVQLASKVNAGTGSNFNVVTIVDNDPAPTVTLVLTPSSIDEDGGSTRVTAGLSNPSSQATTVTVSAAAVAPAVPGDFTLSSNRMLTIAAGATTSTGMVTVTVTANDNNVDAPDKRVTVSAMARNTQGIEQPVGKTLTIMDDEASPTVMLALSASSIGENGGTTVATATLTHPSSETTTVTLTPAPGDWTAAGGGVLTIPAGSEQSSGSVTLTAVNDNTDAPDKALTVTASATNGQGVNQPGGVSLTIVDDEAAPTATLTVSAPMMNENGGTATLTVKLDHASSEPTTVTVTASGADPKAAEFTLTGRTLTVPAGQTAGSSVATLTATENDVDAPDQTVTVSATARNTQGIAGNPADVTLTILDDEASPTVTLALSAPAIGEARGEATVTASLSHPSSEETTVAVRAEAVSPAVAGDFTLSSNRTLTIAATTTASTGTLTVTANDNDVDAADKRVTVSATADNKQGFAGHPAALTLTIEDDDERGLVFSPEALTLSESDVTANAFTVALTSEPTETVTLTVTSPDFNRLSLSSEDFTALPDDEWTLTFTPDNWDEPQPLHLIPGGDDDSVTNTVRLGHAAAGGDYGSVREDYAVTLTDVDAPSRNVALSVDRSEVPEGGGAQTLRVTARLDGAALTSAATVAVTVGTGTAEAADFVASPETFDLTITAGGFSADRTVTLTPVDDALVEGPETVTVTGTTTATQEGTTTVLVVTGTEVAIADDDTRGVTVEAADPLAVAENGRATYTVVLDSEPEGAVTVTPEVTGDADVTVTPAELTFTADNWDRAQTVTVSAADDDDTVDDAATVTHAVAGADYGENRVTAASVSVNVGDDDALGVVVSMGRLTVPEGGSMTYTVVLASAPSGTVTVRPTATGDADVTVSPSSLRFTADNWDAAQTVTVSARADADAEDDTATVSHAVSGAAGLTARDVAVTVTDDDTASTGIALRLSPETVDEGGGAKTVTVTVALDGAALTTDTDVSVAVRAGTDAGVASATDFAAVPAALVLTIRAGETEARGTFRLTPDDDDLDEGDGETVEVTGTATVSGTLAVSVYALTIVDDDGRGLEVSRTELAVTEGSSATYTVRLASLPTGPVTVAVSVPDNADVTVRPESLSFSVANWSDRQTVTVEAADDPDGDADMATVTHAATGGGYAGIMGSDVAVEVRDDDRASRTVQLAVDPATVDEAGGAVALTVTATLDGAARASATEIALAVTGGTATSGEDFQALTGLSVTIPANETEGSATVTFTPMDDALDEGLSETVVLGGTVDGLTVRTATLTLADDDGRGIELPAGPVALDEEGETTYEVTLATQPTGEVTVRVTVSGNRDVTVEPSSLTFDASSWDQTQTVTVSAAPDDDAANDEAELRHAASGADYRGVTALPLAVSVEDNDERGVRVSETALTFREGSEATYTVVLDTQPTGPVTVTPSLATGSDADVTISPSSLRFTTSTWNRPQTVTVRAGQDLDQDQDAATVEHAVTGADYGEADVTATEVGLTVTDDDVPSTTITLAVEPETVGEGTRSVRLTVTAELDASPEAEETQVTLSFVDGTATAGEDFAAIDDVTLTIAAGQSGGTAAVTLAPVGDDVDEEDETVRITAENTTAGSNLQVEPSSLEVTIEDDDTRGVTLSRETLSLREAGNTTYTVRLASQPTGPVTVRPSVTPAVPGDPDVTVEPVELTFTADDWDTAQTVTVAAADDADGEDDAWTLAHAVSGGDYAGVTPEDVPVSVSDNDEASRTVTLTVEPVEVQEVDGGATVTVTATLDGAARSVETEVALAVTGGTAEAGPDFDDVAGATVTIPAGEIEADGTFFLSVENDDIDEDDGETVTLGGTAEGLTVRAAELTIVDDDERGIVVSDEALTLTEEDRGRDYTVALASAPTGPVTVRVTVSGDRDVTVQPSSLAFTAENWDQTQTVTVTAAPDDDASEDVAELRHAASGADYRGVTGEAVAVTVTDDDTPGVTVSATAIDLREGGSATYTVVLDTQPTGPVTVTPAAAGAQGVTVSPSSLRFTPSNWNRPQTVTVRAGQDDDMERVMVTVGHAVDGADGVDYVDLSVTVPFVDVAVSDDEAPSTKVTLSVSPATVREGAGPTSLTVTAELDGAPVEDAATEVTLSLGAGTDFEAGDDVTLTIPAGAVRGTARMTLTPVDDEIDGPDETKTVRITGTTTSSLRVTGTEVTIADDDTRGLVVSRRAVRIGGNGEATYTVRLATRPRGGADVLVTPTLHVPPGVTVAPDAFLRFTTANWNVAQTVTVAVAPETVYRAGETAAVVYEVSGADYGSVPGGEVVVSLTYRASTPSELPVVSIADAAAAEGAGTMSFAVTLSSASRRPVSVDWSTADGTATAGADYEAATGRLTFAAGEIGKTVAVTLLDDAAGEDDETFTVTLSAPAHARLGVATATATIADDEARVTLAVAPATVPEGGGAATVTVTAVLAAARETPTEIAVVVSGGTAEAATDFAAVPAFTVTVPAGATEGAGTFELAPVDDALDEGAGETVTVGGRAPGFAVTPAELTLADDDTRGLTVAPASVRLHRGGAAVYTVVLASRPAGAVTVTPSLSGPPEVTVAPAMLTFTVEDWDTPQTVTVSAAAGVADGTATVTHAASGADYAEVVGGAVTVTLADDDTRDLTVAWLARFGRTVATHVTDAVGDRLRGTPGQGSHITVGGYRLPVGQRGTGDAAPGAEADTEAATDASSLEALVTGLAGVLGLGPGQAGGPGADALTGGGLGWDPWGDPPAVDPRLGQSHGVNLDLRRLLLGSSFRLAFGRDDGGGGWPRLTAWGRVAGTTFDGREGDLSLDGDVLMGTVGVDGEWERLLAGLAVAHSRGNGSFTLPGTEVRGPSGVENTLTSVHPYLRYAVNDRLDVWGVLGYGTGQVELERDTGETLATDMDLVMGAFGGRGILLAAPEGGGFELATRTDAMLTRTSSDTVAGLAAGDAEAHRLRLILEGSRGFAWAEGRSLTPTMQLGLRHDWGDAETGFGLELGGRVQYADPALGLTIEGAVRGLLAHEDRDYKEWGASGSLRLDPGAMGRGLSLTLAPTWGAASSGLDGLWSRQTTAGLAPQGRQRRQGQANLQVGYGIWLPALGGTLTPGAGLQLTNNGQSQSRASLVFDGLRTQAGALRLALEGGRTANPSGPPAYNIGLQLQLTFGNAGQATPAPTGPAASAPAMRHSTPTGPAASTPAVRHSTPAAPAASAPARSESHTARPARSESHTARPAEQRAEAGDRHYFVQLGAFRHPDDADRARHDLAGDLAGLLQRPDTPRLAVLGSPQGGPTRILFAKPYPTRTAAAALCATVTAYGTACQIKTARHHPANSP